MVSIMCLSSIDIIKFPTTIYNLASSQIIHSYGYKDKMYPLVTSFVPVLVILVYMLP